jgi:hypothetical protein
MSHVWIRWGGPPERHPVGVLIGATICLVGIGIGLDALFRASALPHWPIIGGAAAYLIVSYMVQPHSDTDDLGWCGGLMDNPFSFSDDVNRGLLVLGLLLLPGRIVSELLVGAAVLPWRLMR